MKFQFFLLTLITLLITEIKSETTPQIPIKKFKMCNSLNLKNKIKILKPLQRLEKNGKPINCKPLNGVFDKSGKYFPKPLYSEIKKNCILIKKYCFLKQIYEEKFLMPSDGQLLQQLYAKVYSKPRSMMLKLASIQKKTTESGKKIKLKNNMEELIKLMKIVVEDKEQKMNVRKEAEMWVGMLEKEIVKKGGQGLFQKALNNALRGKGSHVTMKKVEKKKEVKMKGGKVNELIRLLYSEKRALKLVEGGKKN